MKKASLSRERGCKAKSFRWTAAEWAVLEPLSEAERMGLMTRALFSGLGIEGQARRERRHGSVESEARTHRS